MSRAAIAALLVAGLLAIPPAARADCHPIKVTPYSPTGIAGCEVYGLGVASMWQGPGAARNDCLWPWRHCQPVRVLALRTGRSIVIRPTMFCDCYTGTPRRRIIDLSPAIVRALGLPMPSGLWAVRVSPVRGAGLPDTAMRP